eukprot:CAMPEP_0176288856 /NCGR_PEP_ID=MMETSP0121_2-20121125/54192_1 /TAXON_ID=160619 /ORGANISM="Kryptoperidinium foliaceum, Strain CCMP 1326" /LENGTH=59 /DNA_ID=CAMNT_0017629567 /DNA_START=53 /DNA_END=232 /DNA_ORIENTATION=+
MATCRRHHSARRSIARAASAWRARKSSAASAAEHLRRRLRGLAWYCPCRAEFAMGWPST